MIEPPGAPGEATIAMPSVMMNGMTVARLIGSWFIRQTAVAHAVIVIMEPAIWMFAQSGTTKLRIWEHTPSASAHCRLTGIVAAEDCVPRAVVYPGTWFFIRVRGFFLLTEPAIVNWIKMQIRCIAITTRKTFQRIPRIAKVLRIGHVSEVSYKPSKILHFVILHKNTIDVFVSVLYHQHINEANS